MQVIQQAGQVWFPDSAYKTAQAIKDFGREELPLIIFANWRGFSGGMKGTDVGESPPPKKKQKKTKTKKNCNLFFMCSRFSNHFVDSVSLALDATWVHCGRLHTVVP